MKFYFSFGFPFFFFSCRSFYFFYFFPLSTSYLFLASHLYHLVYLSSEIMSEVPDRKKRLAQLAALKRSSKKTRVESYEDATPLYDIVDEDQYRRNLADDDFVEINDGDHGYAYDDGTNDLGDSKHNYYSDDDIVDLEDNRSHARSKKRKANAKQEIVPPPKKPQNKSIKSFMGPVVKEQPVCFFFLFFLSSLFLFSANMFRNKFPSKTKPTWSPSFREFLTDGRSRRWLRKKLKTQHIPLRQI